MKRILAISRIIFSLLGIQEASAQAGTVATDGIYIPRLTTANRNAIATPTNGQLIFNSDDNCFNVFQYGSWQKLCGFEAPTSEAWTQKTNFGGAARSNAIGFSIGSKGYIGLANANNDLWEYDPTTNAWTQKANFGGTGRYDAVGFSIGNKGYVGTGNDGSAQYFNDFWEYDPTTNIWSQKAGVSAIGRNNAVGFSIGNKGYIGTGTTINIPIGSEDLGDFWEYDPTGNSWTQKANLTGGARSSAVGFSIGNKGYIGTGNAGTDKKDFWEYNPATNTWSQKADFGGTARNSAVGFSIGSKGYIGTGTLAKDFWEYDPTGNAWTQKINYGGAAINSAVGFSIGAKGYIGTGSGSGGATNDFWEYSSGNGLGDITLQGNTFNGPNQLVKLDGAGSFPANLTINGNLTVGGQLLPSENFTASTLYNNWVNYDVPNGYAAAGYFKDIESIVHLKGLIKNGTTTNGTTILVLPEGYRPGRNVVFTVANSGVSLARIDVYPDGSVKIVSGGNTYLSLNGISFRAN